jgi:DNA-binding PadR family transcriptional regulator
MAKELAGDLLRGNLELMILSSLADGAKYGYLIQQRLGDASRGLISVKAGTLYPILHKLEEDKLVKCRWEDTTGRQRKWYELTAKGEKRLHHRASQWQQLAATLQELLNPVLGPDAKPAFD